MDIIHTLFVIIQSRGDIARIVDFQHLAHVGEGGRPITARVTAAGCGLVRSSAARSAGKSDGRGSTLRDHPQSCVEGDTSPPKSGVSGVHPPFPATPYNMSNSPQIPLTDSFPALA
jgi:hypothetical protein